MAATETKLLIIKYLLSDKLPIYMSVVVQNRWLILKYI